MEAAAREREFVHVTGPDAADYLQRMVSNDVEALAAGEACPALLLTAKARVIAPLVVLRRTDDDFLVLTEAGQALYPFAQRIQLLHQEAREAVTGRPVPLTGDLSLAASSVPQKMRVSLSPTERD